MKVANESLENIMKQQKIIGSCVAVLIAGSGMALAHKFPEKGKEVEAVETVSEEAGTSVETEVASKAPAVKPLSEQVLKGIAFLRKTQNPDGGWGQGGGWRQNREGSGRVEGAEVNDPSDVGNSCVATMVFLRAGADLKTGEHAESLRKAWEYVHGQLQAADEETLYVTTVRDTQLQSKIGRYVDTFLATQMLAELKGKMVDEEGEIVRAELLDKLVLKIGKNQQEDGSFKNNAGWASVLSQGLCSLSLNCARQAGAKVPEVVLERDNNQNAIGLDPKSKVFSGPVGASTSAGVALYSESSKLRGMKQYSEVNRARRGDLTAVQKDPSASVKDKDKAEGELKKIDAAEVQQKAAVEAVAKSVQSKEFVAGFGNNGGEEFLSYRNVTESLRLEGGKAWQDWDIKVTGIVNKAQNEDGSWAGHHCITGRTYCTSEALLTLMADRAPLLEKKEEVAVVAPETSLEK